MAPVAPKAAAVAPKAAVAPVAPKAAAVAPVAPKETFASIDAKMIAFVATLFSVFGHFADSYVEPETTTLKIPGKGEMKLRIRNVRGDGACGLRAFISALLWLFWGIILPKAPDGMDGIIVAFKVLLLGFANLLAANPENADFIKDLLSIPQNGVCENLHAYAKMVMKPDYYATNFELQMLTMMIGKVSPFLKKPFPHFQLNVIRGEPTDVESHQSFSADGSVEKPSSQWHANLLNHNGHFWFIIGFDNGRLPHLCFSAESLLVCKD